MFYFIFFHVRLILRFERFHINFFICEVIHWVFADETDIDFPLEARIKSPICSIFSVYISKDISLTICGRKQGLNQSILLPK